MQTDPTKTVLITGASGFLGSYLVEEFRSTGGWRTFALCRSSPQSLSRVLGVEYIVCPVEGWPDILKELEPHVVIHCAGGASVPGSLQAPLADFFSGPVITCTLLDAVRQFAPACAFIFLSSAAVYGEQHNLPIGESAPLRPISPYGYHKTQSELTCREYAAVYGLRTASARIFSAYGNGLRRQVVWDLCRKACVSDCVTLSGIGTEFETLSTRPTSPELL